MIGKVTDNEGYVRIKLGKGSQQISQIYLVGKRDSDKKLVWETYIIEGKNACDAKAVDENVLVEAFVRMFNKIYENKQSFIKTLTENIEMIILLKPDSRETEALDKRIEELKNALKKLIRFQVNNNIDNEVYTDEYRSIYEELGGVRKKRLEHDKVNESTKYVLVDSWFSSHEFIQTVRGLGKKPMHLICGVRKDGRKYLYKGYSLNADQLQRVLKNEGQEKRCRKRNTRYFEAIVDYEGIGLVKLYFCRFPYQKKWRLFLSTDTSLSLLSMLEIYSVRWDIIQLIR